MERVRAPWQLILGALCLAGMVFLSVRPAVAAPQRFAVALPELEGPLTLAVFSTEGKRVRMLCQDADVTTLPAGLNGLIMIWDGKDDQGHEAPPGAYRVRGLVHGPISCSLLPSVEMHSPIVMTESDAPWEKSPFPRDGIALRSYPDELLESRPLLQIRAVPSPRGVTLEAEGVPLAEVPVMNSSCRKILLSHGSRTGTAHLTLRSPGTSCDYSIAGLDRIVPLDAGELTLNADSSQVAPDAGESRP